jgi:hypothetical protein
VCFRQNLEGLRCSGQNPKSCCHFEQNLKIWLCWEDPKHEVCFRRNLKIVVLWAELKDLLKTASDAAEGVKDTRFLGDPMDLIRCQSYLAKHGEHAVQQGTN